MGGYCIGGYCILEHSVESAAAAPGSPCRLRPSRPFRAPRGCLPFSLACRGTQSMQNVLTDLKAWMAPLQPERRVGGSRVKVRWRDGTAMRVWHRQARRRGTPHDAPSCSHLAGAHCDLPLPHCAPATHLVHVWWLCVCCRCTPGLERPGCTAASMLRCWPGCGSWTRGPPRCASGSQGTRWGEPWRRWRPCASAGSTLTARLPAIPLAAPGWVTGRGCEWCVWRQLCAAPNSLCPSLALRGLLPERGLQLCCTAWL
jgi:hypothetical protein